MNEKISVITTLYNYADYIVKCVESFLAQDYKNSEMIIVDDASTDNPWPALMRYRNNDRIKVIRHENNFNYSRAKNTGIKAATGDILVLLDADDYLTCPDSLSLRYNRICETGAHLVHGPCLRLEPNKPLFRDPMWGKWLDTKDPKWIHAQGVMMFRAIHKTIGLYDPSLWASADREMFYRIADAGFRIETVDQDVAVYRVHSKQMSTSKKKQEQKKALKKYIRKKREIRRAGNYSGLEMLKI